MLATEISHSVRDFVEAVFPALGRRIKRRGTGVDEKGLDAYTGLELITVDPRYHRPTEVGHVLGDDTKFRAALG